MAEADGWQKHIGNVKGMVTAPGTKRPAGARANEVIKQKRNGATSGLDGNSQLICEIQFPWSEDEIFNQAIGLPHRSEGGPAPQTAPGEPSSGSPPAV